jgi:type IV secretory pathway component VirB8
MNQEQDEVAALMRSGKYYEEARSWYRSLYIGPISERSFFLLISGLAILTAFIGFIGVMMISPVRETVPMLIKTNQPDVEYPLTSALRSAGEPVDVALERFFVMQYVGSRESYDAKSYAQDSAFVRAHSDPTTANAYSAVYGSANPRSPVNVLAQTGKRQVVMLGVEMPRTPPVQGQPQTAIVKFSTELVGIGVPAKTQWTATVSYYYSPLTIAEQPDSEELQVKDSQFQVVSYAVSQTP